MRTPATLTPPAAGDLTERLMAAIEQSEKLAQEARQNWDRMRIEAATFQLWPAERMHAVAWNPDAALRHAQQGRAILRRHTSDGEMCEWCDLDTWPCHEVLDLAQAWGVAP